MFFGLFFSLFSQSPSNLSSIPEGSDFWSEYPHEELADYLVSKMSDEELLAQILMFGWAGAEPSALLNQWVLDRGLGSVKVFGWNTDDTEQVAKSVTSLQQEAQSRRLKIPLYVATDQEGGWIRHVKGDTSETPGNMAIGASSYPIDSYYSAYYISREIKALGINMNFAPTIDLYTNRDSSVIGARSFGEDPDFVGQLGAAFVAGSLAAGVIPTAKHFPGHGDTSADSHGKLPEIFADYQTLEKRELVPFKYLISQNIPAIMSGHLSFPRIIPNGEPASLSRTFLTDILRDRLHYQGLIITDDMMMNGATMYAGSSSEAFRLAIEAGNDIIISSRTAELDERLWTMNYSNMQISPEFHKIVEKAARRVILSKLVYFKGGNAAPLYPELATLKDKIPDKEGQRFFLSQACRSITAYKADGLPYKSAEGERILLAGPNSHQDFFDEAEKRFGKCAKFPYNPDMGPYHAQWVIDNLTPLAQSYDTIIICVDCKNNAAAIKPMEELAKNGKKIIIMSILSPVPLLNGFDFAQTILFGYSYSPYTFKALFAALAGDFTPQGKVPLNQ